MSPVELTAVRPADIKVGDHIRIHDFDDPHYPEKYDVVEDVRMHVEIRYRHVDTLCPDGGCEGCGGGDEDYKSFEENEEAFVWTAVKDLPQSRGPQWHAFDKNDKTTWPDRTESIVWAWPVYDSDVPKIHSWGGYVTRSWESITHWQPIETPAAPQ